MPPRPRKPQKVAHAKLRIIGGAWRGRLLSFPELEGLRPTGNRIRETLFNWLQPYLPGSTCLDLFAGSGALGYEALSRGAARCVFVERQRQAAEQLRANQQILKADGAEIVEADALAFLASAPPASCDIVFIDPPFAQLSWNAIATALETYHWLAEDGLIYIETPLDFNFVAPPSWRLHRHKQAGSVNYSLYRKETSPGAAR